MKSLSEYSNYLNLQCGDFCYLLGLVKSDGCISSGISIELSCKQLIEDIANSIEWFEFKDTSKEVDGVYRNYYSLWRSKNSVEYRVFSEILSESKKDMIIVNKLLQEEDNIVNFLRGYFDGDGSIFLENEQWCMDFVCNINEVGLIMALLNRVDIKFNIHFSQCTNVIELRIKNRANIVYLTRKFYNGKEKFTMLSKKEKLMSIKPSNKLTYEEELELKSLIESGLSLNEIVYKGYSKGNVLSRIDNKEERLTRGEGISLFKELVAAGELNESKICTLTGICKNTFYNRVQTMKAHGEKVDDRYLAFRRKLSREDSENLNKEIKEGYDVIELSKKYKVTVSCIKERKRKLNIYGDD